MSDEHVILPGDEPDPPAARGDAPASDVPAVPEPVVVPGCGECGAPIDGDQQYCLQCGAPTPSAVPLRRRGASGPVIAAALLALGIGGGAVIYALTREDDGTSTVASVPTTTVGTMTGLPPFTTGTDPFGSTTGTDPFGSTTGADPFGSTTGADPFGSTTGADPFGSTSETDATPPDPDPFGSTSETDATPPDPDPFGSTETDATPAPDPDPAPSDGTDDWTGGDGYTVILSSVRDRAEADSFKSRVQATGRSAGVLVSDNYGSLRPGYYAVFSGTYSTAAAARQAAAGLRASYRGAYAQRVAS